MITLDSFNEKVIPSITDRVKCFRLCRLSIPIKLPEFDYLDTEFFLLLYRSKNQALTSYYYFINIR